MGKSSNYLNWSESSKKQLAREDTILTAYRTLAGQWSIPSDKQYWSMCGQNVNEDGTPRDHGEYLHLLEEGLYRPDQFFGVEINPVWHELNTHIKGPTWLSGDFYTQMVKYSNEDNFNPAIVNMDHIRMPKSGGAAYLAKILSLLTDLGIEDVMVVGNLLLKCYCYNHDYLEIPQTLLTHRLFAPIRDKWTIHPEIYEYNGANEKVETASRMGTILVYR